MSRFWQHFVSNGTPDFEPADPTPAADEATALDAFSNVVVRVAETLRPAVVNLRVGRGRQMGSGPGGSVIADIEIRYTLGRGDSGVYTYSIFSHPTNYAATSVGEGRFCAKLNDALFDWMTVDIATGDCIPEPDSGTHSVVVKPLG